MPTLEAESHLAAYLDELAARRYSESALSLARYVAPLFFRFLRDQGVDDLRQVREAHLARFARVLREWKTARGSPLAPWTRSSYLSALKGFFAFLDRRSVILRDPARSLRLPRGRRLPRRVLSRADVRRLLEAPSPTSTLGLRDRALIEAFYGTGIRLKECHRLEISDVDLGAGLLWVRNGKGRKDRLLPIPRGTQQSLDRYLKDARSELVHDTSETAFFLASTGRRLSTAGIQLILRLHGQAAGLPAYPHALRHACATHLLKGGADIRHIQKLLGHSHIETTTIYARVAVKDLKQIVDKAHPREISRSRKRR